MNEAAFKAKNHFVWYNDDDDASPATAEIWFKFKITKELRRWRWAVTFLLVLCDRTSVMAHAMTGELAEESEPKSRRLKKVLHLIF